MSHFDHIIVPDTIKQVLDYSSRSNGGGRPTIPIRNRAEHAAYLQQRFDEVRTENENLKRETTAIALPARNGTYIEFAGAINSDLVAKSLEDQRAGIRLLNIRNIENEDAQMQTFATVYIPHGQESKLISKLHKYATEDTPAGKPKNDTLFRSIECINLALLKGIWTDRADKFPDENNDWYEVWIQITDEDSLESQHQNFIETLHSLNITFKENAILNFPERSVFLIYGNKTLLSQLLASSDQLAEVRSGQVLTSFVLREVRGEQQEWIHDMTERLQIQNENSSVICVMDSGVNNGHPLLAPIINDDYCDSVVGQGSADRDGHGTAMCGLTIYGDLLTHIANNLPITINNKICSIKLIPYNTQNPKEAWGALTAQAVSASEIIFPKNKICYCMAITSEESDNGIPSSWSGEVDALAFNDGNNGRLFLISAGNIEIHEYDIFSNYPDNNGLRKIQNPAQSWNGLAIGAFTNLVAPDSQELQGYQRIAPSGGISPFSRTSLLWEKSALVKPDLMFEGGNAYKTNDDIYKYSTHDDLELTTTSSQFQIRGYFNTMCATSAATALAAKLAGAIQTKYPNLWAESIRGLMVHSAKWTPQMELQFPVNNRKDMQRRLRFCGYGTPLEERALHSSENGFTYIAQGTIQPFIKKRGESSTRVHEMHLFELPWPKEILENLAEVNVTMRITLSYFIEPAPGEIGWKDKYRYANCGLRFDVNNEGEDERAFKLRLNKLIEAEENEERGSNDSTRWLIGSDNRNKGSIHSDELNLTAAQLATCNLITVFPIGGWWKTRTNLKCYNKSMRYSLIVSLDTPVTNIDLYSVVKTKIDTIINAPVDIEIPIRNN